MGIVCENASNESSNQYNNILQSLTCLINDHTLPALKDNILSCISRMIYSNPNAIDINNVFQ